MISPILGYSSLSNSKKYEELLRTVGEASRNLFWSYCCVTLEISETVNPFCLAKLWILDGPEGNSVSQLPLFMLSSLAKRAAIDAGLEFQQQEQPNNCSVMMMGNAWAGGLFNGGTRQSADTGPDVFV